MSISCFSLLFVSSILAFAVDESIQSSDNAWTLTSGETAYRLVRQNDHLRLDYFGPSSQMPASPHPEQNISDLDGLAEGESLNADHFRIAAAEVQSPQANVQSLNVTLVHLDLPLEIIAVYTAWGKTGVITRQLTLKNTGGRALSIASCPSLSLNLAGVDYTLRYLQGSWGEERQLATEKVTAGIRRIESQTGRSTNGFAPWISLRDDAKHVEYLMEMAWSGNWSGQVETPIPGSAHDRGLSATMRASFDFDGPVRLAPGRSLVLPVVELTAAMGDLDDVSNQLHCYQRQYVFPRQSANRPMLVQFNSWYPFPGNPTVESLRRLADVAAGLGAEIFVLDAGWYSREDWAKELGDYQPDPVSFPNGLEEVSSYLRNKGMKFGLWLEIENVGVNSHIYKEHADWCLAYNGSPIRKYDRCQLDFAKPEVREWATATVNRLVNRYQLSWIKIDYNIDIGNSFDPHGEDRTGDVLYQYVMHYYAWLDSIRAAHPDLIIENCSSGGLRFDTGILAHADTNWLSDNVDPIRSLQLGFGCTIQFAPEVCNHWMVGDDDKGDVDLKKPGGWWDFMFRVPMNGQFGISSRVFDWNQALRERAVANIALYKQIRNTIVAADTYHLTAQPSRTDPKGWMAIEYVSPDHQHAVVTAYRLLNGDSNRTFKLRGLDPLLIYSVHFDGRPVQKMSGKELMNVGLPISLDADWGAAICKLDATN